MNTLQQLVERHQADIRPADADSVRALEHKLSFALSGEYQSYLSRFGVIAFGAYETYGLGVPDNTHLNVANAYADLSRDPSYPASTLPLMDVGDGRYYLYDNSSKKIVLWATPNGGVVETLDEDLEAFLAAKIFSE